MDFARRQLEKYGWTDGKGLGKHENGISEALKPKLKRSVTGIGHDAAAEFNEHWWSALYDKAAKNVEVQEKNGKTKKIKTVDGEDFTITNSTWRINKKRKTDTSENEYSEYFIRKAVFTNDGTKVENQSSESESEGEKKDAFKMTDEELFKACEGRTAHKGARHGLKALGKLARIAQQEQLLLTQTKYEGYSHAKKLMKNHEKGVEDTSVAVVQDEKPKSKKKKKRCRDYEIDANGICGQAESQVVPLPNSVQDLKSENRDTSDVKDTSCGRKSKNSIEHVMDNELHTGFDIIVKKSKKKKRQIEQIENAKEFTEVDKESIPDMPKKKKKKNRVVYKQ